MIVGFELRFLLQPRNLCFQLLLLLSTMMDEYVIISTTSQHKKFQNDVRMNYYTLTWRDFSQFLPNTFQAPHLFYCYHIVDYLQAWHNSRKYFHWLLVPHRHLYGFGDSVSVQIFYCGPTQGSKADIRFGDYKLISDMKTFILKIL